MCPLWEGLEREGLVKEDEGEASDQEEKHLKTGFGLWVGFEFGINDDDQS